MPFRDAIRRLAQSLQTCDEWLEMVKDLHGAVHFEESPITFRMRWADKRDLFTINALQGFVKETDFMEESLEKGDRCLILEREEEISAFAWVDLQGL